MKPDTPCAKCGSDQIIPKARMIDGRDTLEPTTNLRVGVARKPSAVFFTAEQRSEVFARVCGKCGYVELYAENPGILYRAHLESLDRK